MSNAVLTSKPKLRDRGSSEISHEAPDPPLAPEVRHELERILDSPAFRTSSRSRSFLQHVVTYSNSPDALKERTLGVTLFGRTPDYDTGADAIVRVKANEVRRRLAEYASQADPERNVRIELQPGSYAPKISTRTLQPLSEPAASSTDTKSDVTVNRHPRSRGYLIVAVLIAILSLTCWQALKIRATHSPARRFLQPFLDSEKPIICISHPNAYNLLPGGAGRKGDAQEALRLRDRLLHLGRSSRIGVAQDITAEDLSASPMIIVGGPRFNYWTATLTEGLRFAFDLVNGEPRIYDRLRPTRFWVTAQNTPPQSVQGYVVITRLLATGHQKSVLCIAGLRAIDTRTGAQVISDPKTLDKLLKDAPDDWDKKNLQWVVHILALNNAQPQVELRAATYW